MDLFEIENAFRDVIVLQTVLEEVKNRSLPLYHRLVNLTKIEDKRFYTFFNDFRIETYVTRNHGESINDRNDRAIRRAAAWYQDHLNSSARKKSKIPVIVIISDDRENLAKANADGLTAVSLAKYITGLENADQLLDMANESRDRKETKAKGQKDVYPEYYSMSKMLTGIKAGTMQGHQDRWVQVEAVGEQTSRSRGVFHRR